MTKRERSVACSAAGWHLNFALSAHKPLHSKMQRGSTLDASPDLLGKYQTFVPLANVFWMHFTWSFATRYILCKELVHRRFQSRPRQQMNKAEWRGEGDDSSVYARCSIFLRKELHITRVRRLEHQHS